MKINNCHSCKYMEIGGSYEWSDYCRKQNWKPIKNLDIECCYYKRSLIDKICCFLFNRFKEPYSNNIYKGENINE